MQSRSVLKKRKGAGNGVMAKMKWLRPLYRGQSFLEMPFLMFSKHFLTKSSKLMKKQVECFLYLFQKTNSQTTTSLLKLQ